MYKLISKGIYLITAAILLVGPSVSENSSAIVNLMIDFDVPDPGQLDEVDSSAIKLINEINSRSLNATIFLTQDITSSSLRLRATRIGRFGNYELAMSGNITNEDLTSLTYSEQEKILSKSKNLAEDCYICGVNEIFVKGFLPQSFAQNEDTFRALDSIGIEYNVGFQEGIIYAPGHQEDVWPYKLKDHKFYAVPISSIDLDGEKLPLSDQLIREKGKNGDQWYGMLVSKFDEAVIQKEPLILLLSTSLSGGDAEYRNAFARFLDYALLKNAGFISTIDLVDMSKKGVYEIPPGKTTISKENISTSADDECPTCDEKKRIGANISEENETISSITNVSVKMPI